MAAAEAAIEHFMATATGLGDAAITMPVAAILFASFLLTSRRLAMRWVWVVAACGGVTILGKLAIYAYGQPISTIQLGSPSGHAAASILVYGALALEVGRARQRALPAALAVLTVVLIAVSRIYLGSHTEADVLVGMAIGGVCLACFAPVRAVGPAWPVQIGAVASILLCVTGAALGWRFSMEPWLHSLAIHVIAPALAAPGIASPA